MTSFLMYVGWVHSGKMPKDMIKIQLLIFNESLWNLFL